MRRPSSHTSRASLRDVRERLTKAGAIEALFTRFDAAIREAGYIAPLGDCGQSSAGQRMSGQRMSGQIVDASLVSAPKQRNTEAEKVTLRAGRIPEDWQDTPAKLRQMDRDARWRLVFGTARERADGTRHADIAIPVLGYKSHASIDRRHHAARPPLRDVIRRWDVTDAAAHDGRMLRRGLLDKTNTGSTVWAASRRSRAIACRPMDSAYRSKAND